ncbi:hypothetical protein P879_06249 [Paragonimus westermani]|uniref:Uncharacterized protein n=1 Tax=Paragonimus westermani TaxID=34504 RepID=A0A8T0DLJ6_9TREM|nr:hypothetical protein P879_06249 [Paragonimus westermani]
MQVVDLTDRYWRVFGLVLTYVFPQLPHIQRTALSLAQPQRAEANDYYRNYRLHHLRCDHRFRYQIIVTLCIRSLVRAVTYRRISRVVSS